MARTLTELQEGFCVAFVQNGGKGRAAAITAGYSQTSAGQAVQGLLRNEQVLSRIREVMLERMVRQSPMLLKAMAKLATTARSESVRLQAIKDLLDRSGTRVPDGMDTRPTKDVDLAALLARASTLTSELTEEKSEDVSSVETDDPPIPPIGNVH